MAPQGKPLPHEQAAIDAQRNGVTATVLALQNGTKTAAAVPGIPAQLVTQSKQPANPKG